MFCIIMVSFAFVIGFVVITLIDLCLGGFEWCLGGCAPGYEGGVSGGCACGFW